MAGVLSFFAPQIGGIAAGFAIIWALAWRRQEAAVSAIEERDGARFYVDKTSPLSAIRLIRTPGFGGDFLHTRGVARGAAVCARQPKGPGLLGNGVELPAHQRAEAETESAGPVERRMLRLSQVIRHIGGDR